MVKNVRDAIIESALRLTRRNFGGGLTRGLPIALRLIHDRQSANIG
jgi:hypothetical protein